MQETMKLIQRNGWYYVKFTRTKKKALRTRNAIEAQQLFNIIQQEYFKEKIAELDGGKRKSLSAFKDIFLDRHTEIDEDTSKAYDLAIRLLIDSLGGSTLLSRIDDKSIAKFKRDCLTRGCKRVSVNTYLRHLRGFFNRAFDWDYIDHKVKIEFCRTPKRHPRILFPDEVELLLLHSYHCHYEMHRIIKFALWTGARREEIHSLTYQHIHGCTARLIGKGDKERTVPLLPSAIKATGEQKDIGPVFLRVHIDYYTKAFKSLIRDCGIEDASFHTLRHTAATYMLASGIDIKLVKEILGHADIKTTELYAHVLQQQLSSQIQKLRFDKLW